MQSETLKQELINLQANFCSALSDPSRLLILYALDEQPLNVTEICLTLAMSQSNVSKHLKILKEKGLVASTKIGTVVTYSLVDKKVITALDLLRSIMRDDLKKRSDLINHPILQAGSL